LVRNFRMLIYINSIYTSEIIWDVNLMQKFKKVVYVCLRKKYFPPSKPQSSATFRRNEMRGSEVLNSVRPRAIIHWRRRWRSVYIYIAHLTLQKLRLTVNYEWRFAHLPGGNVTSDQKTQDCHQDLLAQKHASC